MAIARVRKFTEIIEVETFLNGGLIFGDLEKSSVGAGASQLAAGIDGLVGKTLKFTSPSAVTVTFTASAHANPSVLLAKDIIAQIEAAIATVKVTTFGRRLVLVEVTPSSGVAVAGDGTANALLGIGVAALAGKVYAAPPSAVAPCWTWATVDPSNGQHVIYTFE